MRMLDCPASAAGPTAPGAILQAPGRLGRLHLPGSAVLYGFRAAGLALMVFAIVCAPPARACMVCVADPLETLLVSELDGAGQVVVARPFGKREDGRFRIERIYRGPSSLQTGREVSARLPLFSEDRGKIGLGPVLLTRRGEEAKWVIRAPADKAHLEYFEAVLTLPPASSDDLLDRLNRAVFFARHLHHEEAVLARTSAAQVARLPYPMLKKIRSRLDLEKVRAALRDPSASDRYALHTTILGVCGEKKDALRIRQSADRMWNSGAWKNLGAVLTARLEFEGEPAVAEIEKRYFRDRNRTLPEIEQAIAALRVHGEADDTISRQRVIESFRTLFEDRQPLVSLIVPDLIRWQDWDSRDALLKVRKSHGVDFPDLRLRVEAYLKLYPGARPSTTVPRSLP